MMRKEALDLFNKAYSSVNMYFGWKVRCELRDIIESESSTGKTALDIGCGEGRYSVYLAQRGFSVTAVDLADAGINKLRSIARDKKLNIICKIQDLQDFEFYENNYDVIVASTVLEHLDHPTREQVIAGLKKTLKPGGIIFASVFTVQDPGYQIKLLHSDESKTCSNNIASDCRDCIEHYYKQGELKRQFSELELVHYAEILEPDMSHGKPHYHGEAILIVRKFA